MLRSRRNIAQHRARPRNSSAPPSGRRHGNCRARRPVERTRPAQRRTGVASRLLVGLRVWSRAHSTRRELSCGSTSCAGRIKSGRSHVTRPPPSLEGHPGQQPAATAPRTFNRARSLSRRRPRRPRRRR
eukprot:287337-Chlamydomonas_euryale.AAC.2